MGEREKSEIKLYDTRILYLTDFIRTAKAVFEADLGFLVELEAGGAEQLGAVEALGDGGPAGGAGGGAGGGGAGLADLTLRLLPTQESPISFTNTLSLYPTKKFVRFY